MRGGPSRPIDRPMRNTSSFLAPMTEAILSAGTSCQLRQMNACMESGKWGNATGAGEEPTGRSESARMVINNANIKQTRFWLKLPGGKLFVIHEMLIFLRTL